MVEIDDYVSWYVGWVGGEEIGWGRSSWRTPWRQSWILLCALALLNFVQLKMWSYGSRFWPHMHFLYVVMCGSSNCSFLRIIVLNSKGDSLKNLSVWDGVIIPFDELVFRSDGSMRANSSSSLWVRLLIVWWSIEVVMYLDVPLRDISRIM